MNDLRAEHQRHYDCLSEELHSLNQRVLDVQYERDKEAAWLDGWDARDALRPSFYCEPEQEVMPIEPHPANTKLPPSPSVTAGADGDIPHGWVRRRPPQAKAAQ